MRETGPRKQKGGPREPAAAGYSSAPLAEPSSQHKQEARDQPTEEKTGNKV